MQFTIEPDRWYACEIIGDEFHEDCCSYSPIKIRSLTPAKSGKRLFKLAFYHANYPDGVRDKQYELVTLVRSGSFILAKATDHPSSRILQIYDISGDWLERHFNQVSLAGQDVRQWLDQNA